MASQLSRRVKRRRADLGITQGQLSMYSSVSQAHISRLESGRVESLGGEALKKVARALETTTDYLLGMSNNPAPPGAENMPRTELEWQMLKRFRQLSPEQQRYEIALLDFTLEHGTMPAPRTQSDEEEENRGKEPA